MNITLQEFDETVEAFLDEQDDCDKNEYWMTQRRMAERVLAELRDHLFGDALAKQARYEQYLEFKKEFENEEN